MKKILIAENKHYTLAVAQDKNRAYLKIIGYWRNVDAVPEYLNDWKKTLEKLKNGFTLLTDASEMKTHPQDVRKLHEQAQALVLKMNVSKVAEIIADDITEMQLDSVAKTTQFPKKNFNNIDAAEKWLNDGV